MAGERERSSSTRARFSTRRWIIRPIGTRGAKKSIARCNGSAPEQREAFLLKYVEELGYDEMSQLTGVGCRR